jgi:uncharacterized damage-inducible protein DinB
MPTAPEPWLRNTLTTLDPLRRAVLHALDLTAEDATRWLDPLTDAQLLARPHNLPPITFHLRHIARSLDRLLTYAEGNQLTPDQLAALKSELEGNTPAEARAELHAALTTAATRIRAISPTLYNEPRAVGRSQLPTTVASLLIHCADHTQRHTGQFITTAKILFQPIKNFTHGPPNIKTILLVMLGILSIVPTANGQTKADVLSCIQKAGTDITSLLPCAELAAGVEDHRISEAFQQKSLLPPNTAEAIAREEKEWQTFRSQACVRWHSVADFGCLQTLGAIQADDVIKKVGQSYKYDPGEIPYQLWGTWTVTRMIPTQTISCWDEKQAELLIGTRIEYGPHTYRWKQISNRHISASVSLYDAQSFWNANSSPVSDGSQVDFSQLEISTPLVTSISLSGFTDQEQSDDGAPPGSNALLKSPQQIIFEVCNVYFEASKTHVSTTHTNSTQP